MNKYKSVVIFLLIAAMWTSSMPVYGQDLVAVSDITGGSSVFVFRNSAKAAPKRFVTRVKPVRTRVDRIETAKRVTRQYEALAKVTPRRVRTDVITPDDARVPKIPTMAPGEAAKIFAGVGEYYMNTQEFDRAIEFFRESNTLDKKYVVAQTGLSEALALKGNEVLVRDGAKLARPFFEEALRYNPKNSPAYFGLAEVFSDLDDDATAVANYEKALANDKDLTEIYLPLGILYYQQGEIAKADSLLSKALAKNPDDAADAIFLRARPVLAKSKRRSLGRLPESSRGRR